MTFNNISKTQETRRRLLKCGAILGASTLAAPPSLVYAKKESEKASIQDLVKAQVRRLRANDIISKNDTTAWSVYDFYTKKKLVSINENRYMQAASMMKVFVALAYFYLNKINPRKYPYSIKEKNLMQRMLVSSSNSATNAFIRICGGPANVKALCQKATNNRFKQLYLVEYIPPGGRTYKNKISARDYSRFLYALWHNKLPSALELKRIMGMTNKDRIRGNTIPVSVKIYDKTGSTGHLCGDMGIVQVAGTNRAYTFIGIIQTRKKSRNYSAWIRQKSDAMRTVSAVVYKQMRKRYRINLASLG